MSAHEWEPGDVAMVGDDYEQRRAIVRPRRGANGALEFVYVSGGFDMVGDLADGWSARPLVVIDPEDREQVARLRDEYEAYRPFSTDLTAHMQAALRSLIPPPKPPEPTGLFAQIEDEDGGIWYRSAEQGSVWRRVRRNTDGKRYVGCDSEPRTYDSIAVVKVHNLGWSE